MEKWKFKRSDLKFISTFLSIHFGDGFLQCLYVDRENDSDNTDGKTDIIILTSQTSDLSKGICHLLENVKSRISRLDCFRSKLILVSGFQAETFQSEISKIFDCQVKIISENKAVADGLRFIIDQNDNEPFFYSFEMENKVDSVTKLFIGNIFESMANVNLDKDMIDNQYPILYVNFGSVTTYLLIDKTGEGTKVSLSNFGEKTFLGLAKCLINENNVNSLTALAKNGDQSHIDLLIRDVLKPSGEKPYGDHSADLVLFAFGKLSKRGAIDKLQYNNEDVSKSLIFMILENAVSAAFRMASMTNCRHIYFSGNLFQNESFRQEYGKLYKCCSDLFETYFLKGNMETVTGLLFSNNNDI